MFLLLALPLYCQSFSFGIKGGIPLTEALSIGENGGSVATRCWALGPTVELGLPANVSIGFDALYRSYSFSYQTSSWIGENSTTGHWEFPLCLKYRFGKHLLQPFVEAGVAFDRAHTTGTVGCTLNVCPMILLPGEGPFESSQWGLGALVGGGVEVKVLVLRIAPEIPYTRWQKGAFSSGSTTSGSAISGFTFAPPTGQPNQVEVLVGIRF